MRSFETQSGRAIHRRTGQTFYWATRLLPPRIREDTYTLYGFLRVADEVVDGDNDLSPAEQRRQLAAIRAVALRKQGNGGQHAPRPVRPVPRVVEEFARLREVAGIPAAEVEYFIDAMLADVDTARWERYADLAEYMRGSAAAVGTMMTAIMGVEDPAARPPAIALGEAFQLTNFCRDVREDYRERNRIYLPGETLSRFGVDQTDLGQARAKPGLRKAVQWELRRAEARYRTGVAGIGHLPADCQFPVLLASVFYAEHHRQIRTQEFDVLRSRPTLSGRRKLSVLARTWWHWRGLQDPVAVFDRVSAVKMDQPTEPSDMAPSTQSIPASE